MILDAWVYHIDQSQTPVLVASDGVLTKAKQVIVTLPPALAGRLRYTPAVPMARDHLTQRAAMGWVTKVHCIYPDRFWLADGLSGQITSDDGAVRVCVDNSPPSGSPGILVCFIEGDAAQQLALASLAERRSAVLAELERYFGPQAARPVECLEKSWGDDAFARGPYGGYWKPGLWTALGPALRAAHGAVHWAGAETSARWNGKMEGALLSAERVATEVLARLA